MIEKTLEKLMLLGYLIKTHDLLELLILFLSRLDLCHEKD